MEKLLLIVAVAVMLTGCGHWNETWYVLIANDAFNRGQYQAALQTYWEVLQLGTEVPRMRYNIGCVYRALGEAENARVVWDGAAEARDPELAFRLAYNLGNLAFERGEFRRAYGFYRSALQSKPGDLDTKHNLELAYERLQTALEDGTPSTAAPEPRNQQEAQIVVEFIKRLEGSQWQGWIDRTSSESYSDW